MVADECRVNPPLLGSPRAGLKSLASSHSCTTTGLAVLDRMVTTKALHARLAQVLADAVHDAVLARSPASRRTSPAAGVQRPYVATTEQVRALHDAMGERYRAGLLLAAFTGLRLAEVCGLRVVDVDF